LDCRDHRAAQGLQAALLASLELLEPQEHRVILAILEAQEHRERLEAQDRLEIRAIRAPQARPASQERKLSLKTI
jgi:hypothetical protein